ncbi:MAG: helix-turn-helix transcriptional regulator [Sphingomonadales bacterium]|nr:helix-turn-helix transcriptional regulator [Sphingomonadales bacterium]
MLSRIREVRKTKRLTLLDVAERCVPPTTAQTIGRLETGTRTVSLGWLNSACRALGALTPANWCNCPISRNCPLRHIWGSMAAMHRPSPKSSLPRACWAKWWACACWIALAITGAATKSGWSNCSRAALPKH